MKVKELIKELKDFNQEAEVVTPTSETILLSYIANDGGTKDTTKIVFIEGVDYDETDN